MDMETQDWQWRPMGIGWSVLELRARRGLRLALHLADGGGYVRSVGIWRVGKDCRYMMVVEAADA